MVIIIKRIRTRREVLLSLFIFIWGGGVGEGGDDKEEEESFQKNLEGLSWEAHEMRRLGSL